MLFDPPESAPKAYTEAVRQYYKPDVPNTAEEAEALAMKAEEAAISNLRRATHLQEHGGEDGRPQECLASDLLRHAQMQAENAISYRRIAASMRRRQTRFQQAAE